MKNNKTNKKNSSTKKNVSNKKKTNFKLPQFSLLKSVPLLYFLLIVAIINILYLISKNENDSIILFLIIGLIIYLTKNNMILVLFIPIIVINLLLFL